jgi:excisionase family DNA binding protein
MSAIGATSARKEPVSTENTLTTKEVAKRLGIHPSSIRRLLKQGAFPNAYKVNPLAGNRGSSPYRIPLTDVLEFERLQREKQ